MKRLKGSSSKPPVQPAVDAFESRECSYMKIENTGKLFMLFTRLARLARTIGPLEHSAAPAGSSWVQLPVRLPAAGSRIGGCRLDSPALALRPLARRKKKPASVAAAVAAAVGRRRRPAPRPLATAVYAV